MSQKLCDFGLARSLGKASTSPSGSGGVAPDVEDSDSGGDSVKLTEYVVTRWWRAPEVRGNIILVPHIRYCCCCFCCRLHIKNRSDLYPIPFPFLLFKDKKRIRGHKLPKIKY